MKTTRNKIFYESLCRKGINTINEIFNEYLKEDGCEDINKLSEAANFLNLLSESGDLVKTISFTSSKNNNATKGASIANHFKSEEYRKLPIFILQNTDDSKVHLYSRRDIILYFRGLTNHGAPKSKDEKNFTLERFASKEPQIALLWLRGTSFIETPFFNCSFKREDYNSKYGSLDDTGYSTFTQKHPITGVDLGKIESCIIRIILDFGNEIYRNNIIEPSKIGYASDEVPKRLLDLLTQSENEALIKSIKRGLI